jgi:hypothetical protein
MAFAPGFGERHCSSECADHVAGRQHRKLNRRIHPFDRDRKSEGGKIAV